MRKLLSGTLTVFGLALLAGVLSQRSRVSSLREEHTRLALDAESQAEHSSAQPQADSAGDSASQTTLDTHPSSELLSLRSMVTQLTARKEELEGVRGENKRLRSQLAARGTNTSATLPPSYVRRTQAQWAGMSSPTNTVQSFLWALQSRDLTNLLQLVDSSAIRQFVWQMTNHPGLSSIPGMQIIKQWQSGTNASVEVAFAPGDTVQVPIYFWLENGQWKIVDFPW